MGQLNKYTLKYKEARNIWHRRRSDDLVFFRVLFYNQSIEYLLAKSIIMLNFVKIIFRKCWWNALDSIFFIAIHWRPYVSLIIILGFPNNYREFRKICLYTIKNQVARIFYRKKEEKWFFYVHWRRAVCHSRSNQIWYKYKMNEKESPWNMIRTEKPFRKKKRSSGRKTCQAKLRDTATMHMRERDKEKSQSEKERKKESKTDR